MLKITTASGVELPYIKETLSIKDVNNAFVDSFSLTTTEFPFVILETPAVIAALGSSEINSFTSKKEIDITLIFGAKVYFGKLKVLDYLKNSRSCVLKFGNSFINILDVKISESMPKYYYRNVEEYTATVASYYSQTPFIAAIETDLEKQYPEIDYAAPMINVGKFHTNGEWELYKENFNYQLDGFLLNRRDPIVDGFTYTVSNFNNFVPMPYLMAMLKNPIVQNGYKLAGTFVDNDFNNKIVLLPDGVNNNTDFIENVGVNFYFNNLSIQDGDYIFETPYSRFGLGVCTVKITVTGVSIPTDNTSNVSIQIAENFDPNIANSNIKTVAITEYNDEGFADLTFSVDFTVNADNINTSNLVVKYSHPDETLPTDSAVKINNDVEETILHLIHPTVDLSRYVPNLTLGQLINHLKNWQNLNIEFDETTKTLYLNYNEDFLKNNNHVDLSDEVIKITNTANFFKNKYNLSYANGADNVLITDGVQEVNGSTAEDDVIEIENAFKILKPGLNSKDYLEEAGFTLGLFDGGKFTTEVYNSKTLVLSGENGIVNTYWKQWINFRQSSKRITAVAYLDPITIAKIIKEKKVYFNNRMFAFSSFVTKAKKRLNKVTLELENIMPFKP